MFIVLIFFVYLLGFIGLGIRLHGKVRMDLFVDRGGCYLLEIERIGYILIKIIM